MQQISDCVLILAKCVYFEEVLQNYKYRIQKFKFLCLTVSHWQFVRVEILLWLAEGCKYVTKSISTVIISSALSLAVDVFVRRFYVIADKGPFHT